MLYSLSKNTATYHHQSQSQNSSCSECKRNNYQPNNQEDSSVVPSQHKQSSSSQDDNSAPLRKHIVNQNYQIQHTLRLLQFQVDTLKKQNQAKQKIINQLKYQAQRSAKQEQLSLQMNKQAYQINRLRQELGCSLRNQFQTQQSKFKSVSNRIQRKIQPNYFQSLNSPLNNKKNYIGKNNPQGIDNLTFIVNKQKSLQKYDLKITILQKQVKEYQLQLIQMKQKINYFQQENIWQIKFIYSFVKMCDQLSLNYGQKLHLNKYKDDLKRKTKVCWSYMKDLIGFFINDKPKLNSSRS